MKEIFTDLYKKVLGFFQTQDKDKEENAKDVAVNRMKLVLMQDRTNLTPFLLEKMRGEMVEVLAKYVEMDKEALELNFEQEGDQMALMLSIPVIRAKDEEEINAILEDELKNKEQDIQNEDEDEAESVDEEVEETDEDLQEDIEEEVCACGVEDEEMQQDSQSPDEVEELEEGPSSKKSRKRK